jgi:hypothetical protein
MQSERTCLALSAARAPDPSVNSPAPSLVDGDGPGRLDHIKSDFRFVNVALWESQQAFRDATSELQFRAAPAPFRFHASLYEVVREDH